jgi:hypothetical protein
MARVKSGRHRPCGARIRPHRIAAVTEMEHKAVPKSGRACAQTVYMAVERLEIEVPALASLPLGDLHAMLMAGLEVLECQRVLQKGGLNLVGEVLRGQGTFYEYSHYPHDDVYDADTRAQYYYHAHRGSEHGHFHTFLRKPGLALGRAPLTCTAVKQNEGGDDDVAHLIAISMDAYGWPIGLFATNRWATGETWYPADDVISMLSHFRIDHAYPSWPVNRWISAMIVLYRPHIKALLRHRDQIIADWARLHPGTDVFEDRALEITGSLPISVEGLVQELRTLAGGPRLT